MNDPSSNQFDVYDAAGTPNRHLEWLKAIVRWDGILPLVVASAAPFVRLAFPKQTWVGDLTAVALPIAAFFFRLRIGGRYFETHRHYPWQGVVFFIAVLWLVLLDATLILFNQIPEAISIRDWRVWFLMYAGYVIAMAIALYPLKTSPSITLPSDPSVLRNSLFRN